MVGRGRRVGGHGRWLGLWVLGALLLGSLAVPGAVLPVGATSFAVTVTTTTDVIDGCATTGVAPCSLRDAIRYADGQASADTTTITLPAGVYNLTQIGPCEDAAVMGDLDISKNVILNGANPATTIIDGMGSDRVISVNVSTTTVGISNVTIQHGFEGVACGSIAGGMRVVGNVTLTNVIVTNNVARSGGGINSVGNLTLINSTVANNWACGAAGIGSSNGVLTLINSTVSGNTASITPSGIDCPGAVRGYAGGIDANSTTHITNSTISGNTNTYSYSDDAGGIRNSDTLTIAYSTIAGNSVGGGAGTAGGVSTHAAHAVTMQGSILAGNGGKNCSSGAFISQGYNLSSDGTCALTQPTDQMSANPNLGPLANTGGPTQTHALLAGSLAIDAGGTSAAGCPATDQRGITRPQGARCDSGSYEAAGIAGPTPTVTGIYPHSGPTTGGSKLTIQGTNLQAGTVSVGGAPCAITAASGGTTLICTTAAHAAGTVGVTVTNPGGQNATLANSYTYGVQNALPAPEPGGNPGGIPLPLPLPSRPAGSGNAATPNPLPSSRP
jgi:CSLREA domain-containing protein